MGGYHNLVVGVIWVLISLLISLVNGEYAGELELVQVIFRHGARNPVDYFYPTDPYKDESYWPEGYGQLTKIGKQQHYALGKWLRLRYTPYLSPSYSHHEIRVKSSGLDRTLMSAEVNLAGLYPPNPLDPISEWDPTLAWQPIPVHSIPQKIDNTIYMSAPCPRWKTLDSEFNSGPIMAEYYTENEELFRYLEKNSGREIRTLTDVHFLYDALLIESLAGYELPAWTEGVFEVEKGQFYNLTSLSFRQYTWTEEMARLKCGPLVRELIGNFHKKQKNTNLNGKVDKRLKFLMFSGHDTTLASLLNSLKIWNGRPPPYASAVLMELRKMVNGSFFVEILYKNDSSLNPYLLNVPGCSSSCPLEKFIELSKWVVPVDWEKECHRKSEGEGIDPFVIWGLSVQVIEALVIAGLFFLLLGIYLGSRKQRLLNLSFGSKKQKDELPFVDLLSQDSKIN